MLHPANSYLDLVFLIPKHPSPEWQCPKFLIFFDDIAEFIVVANFWVHCTHPWILWESLWIIRTPQGLGKDWARTAGGPNEEPPAKCAISSPSPVHLQSGPHGLVHMESPGGSGLHLVKSIWSP